MYDLVLLGFDQAGDLTGQLRDSSQFANRGEFDIEAPTLFVELVDPCLEDDDFAAILVQFGL